MKLIRSALCALLLCASPAVLAQYPLELVSLKHRTVEQVLPVLRPLLEPGGHIGGQYGTLAVRTSPGNLRELMRVLETIDRPARRLQISVRHDDAAQRASDGLEAGGRIGERGASVDVRAHDVQGAARERIDQRVHVMEGGRAYIGSAQTRTLPQRQVIQTPAGVLSQQTYAVQELATGFEVTPRLVGDLVHLDIAQQRESPGASPGTIQGHRVVTTVSARLGEWVELGGSEADAMRERRGIGASARESSAHSRRVWVKVEALN